MLCAHRPDSGYGEKRINAAVHIASIKDVVVVGTLAKPFRLEESKVVLERVLDAGKRETLTP